MAAVKANMEAHIVIDGLPANITVDRKEVFTKLLTKKITDLLGPNNYIIKLIDGPAGLVIGAFLDCRTVAEADRAAAKLNKFHLTRADVFTVNRWSDFVAAENTYDEYEPPEEDNDDDVTTDVTNTMMTDKLARPQLLVKAGDQFDVQWNFLFPQSGRFEPVRPSSELAEWSVMDKRAKKLQPGYPQPFPMWSPLGTYIMTHAPGVVKLWGGKVTSLIGEFPAPELRFIHMSPCEKYLVIYGREFSFWDVATCRLIKTIPGEAAYWPVFKYNADDTLVATFVREKGTVLIFEAGTMELLVQELPPRYTIKEDGMCAFAWSPTSPSTFAYAVAGDDNIGFRVQIDRIQRVEDEEDEELNVHRCTIRQLCRRNYFQTKSVDLLWHPLGTHLAAKITKTNDTMSFGVFKVLASSASAEALEIKGEPIRFSWQPNAGRFGVITAESKSAKQKVSFFELSRGFKEVGSFNSGGVRLYWAPKGTRCVSVNFTTSRIEFYGVQGCGPFASEQKMALIISVEHPMITDVEWDPTGRFVCSFTSSLTQQMDNSMMVWNVNGQKIYEKKIPKLSHCTWRPLAPSLLTPEDLLAIKKDLPSKSKKFQEETLEQQRKADEVVLEKKRKAMEKYRNMMDQVNEYVVSNRLLERRAELIAASPCMKAQQERLAKEAPIKEEVEVEEGF